MQGVMKCSRHAEEKGSLMKKSFGLVGWILKLLTIACMAGATAPTAGDSAPTMTGTWSAKGGKAVIEVKWTALTAEQAKGVDHWRLDCDVAAIDRFSTIAKNLPLTDLSYTFEVPDPKRSYSFELHTENADNVNAGVVETACILAPGRTLPPTSLRSPKVTDAANGVISWSWTYDTVAGLKGFRVYVDGKLATDETTLGNDARKWTSSPLTKGAEHTFELEAVGAGGEISERGPKRSYTIRDH